MSNVFFNGQSAVDVVGPNGLGAYSGLCKQDLELKYGRLDILSIDEAVRRIEARACSAPVEITAAEWDEALNVLPPMKWSYSPEVESFRICEATVATVHASYVRLGKRYFCMSRPISDTHDTLVSMATTAMMAKRSRH